tara:strand:- start:424 stop:1044 length:621 start_codon:yes stop_codon:yes gene_type:complete
MKSYKTLFIAFLLLNTSLFAQKYPTLKIGQEMPMQDTEIFDVYEKSMTLNKNTKRKGILVIFTSNSCPFVVMWEDRYKLLEKKCMNSDLGLVYINSNQARRDSDDSVEEMKKHSIRMGYTFPYLIDKNSKIANSFGAKTTPHIFLFNNEKVLVYKGAIDNNYKSINDVTKNYLLDAIQEVNDQKSISISETKAVGCSIKRVKKKDK